MTPQAELMGRCRWLIENRGVCLDKGTMRTHSYRDARVAIYWEYPHPGTPYGPDYPNAHMVVSDVTTGTVIGSYTNQHGGCGLDTPRAQQIVDHLRSIMILDDLVRGVGV
ncbi:MAG: hypothetical protein AB7L09_02800 [Nitrospira sp.]